MNERLKFQGKLTEKEMEVNRLRLKIQGLVTSLRDALDPTEAAEELKAEVVAQQALELADAQSSLKKLLAEIRAIKKILGR
jgi:uncharacterized coiled-coil protein SlyX